MKQLGRGGWQRWGVREAREALAELAESGESTAAFARRKGVSTQRVAYWKKRLGIAQRPAFVAVAIPSPSSGQSDSAQSDTIEIAVDGIVVRLREDVDPDRVARLVEALRRAREC